MEIEMEDFAKYVAVTILHVFIEFDITHSPDLVKKAKESIVKDLIEHNSLEKTIKVYDNIVTGHYSDYKGG